MHLQSFEHDFLAKTQQRVRATRSRVHWRPALPATSVPPKPDMAEVSFRGDMSTIDLVRDAIQ